MHLPLLQSLIRVVHNTDHRVETPLPFSQSYKVPKYKEGIHSFQSRTPTKIFQALDETGGLWWMSKPRRNVHVRKNIRNLFTTPLYIGCIIVLVGVKDGKIRPISKKNAAFSWQFSWCLVIPLSILNLATHPWRIKASLDARTPTNA